MLRSSRREALESAKIYRIFMVPKPFESRLLTNMENMNINCESWKYSLGPALFSLDKESKLKLSVEARNHGDVVIVHCQGRIVYRDEAAALSRVVGEVLSNGSKLVLDLAGVSSIDSAGIGELALLQTWAQDRNAELKCAGPSTVVRTLLELTNLDSVLDVHPTVDSALESFHEMNV
jgi:anti-sigma B factor antagonist